MDARIAMTVAALVVSWVLCLPAFAGRAVWLVWHEGEDYVTASAGLEKTVDVKPPASGGKALYGCLESIGQQVTYRVVVPGPVNDAQIRFRYARLHWRRDMVPARVEVKLSREGRSVTREAVFPDTGGWGTREATRWGLSAVDLGNVPPGEWDLKLAPLADMNSINLDGFFIAPADVAITAEELHLARIRIVADGYCGLRSTGLAISQDTQKTVEVVARCFDRAKPQTSATVVQPSGEAISLAPAGQATAQGDGSWSCQFRLPVLSDGDYTVRLSSVNPDCELDVPVVLVGDLMSTLDRRMAALKTCAAETEAAGDPQGLAVEFEHALAYLAEKRTGVLELQEPGLVVAGMRRTLEQFEETARRLKTGQDPYEGRTGDMRRAFRSAATGKVEQYRLYVPTGYARAERVPFLMLLHGGGQNEDSLPDLDGGVIPTMLEERGYLMVSPMATSGYSGDGQKDLLQLIELTRRQYPKIDPSRIYCTGISRGGFGTYGLVTERPELFAAACCVSGTGDPSRAARLKGVPLLILQGGSDGVVPPEGAKRVAAEMERLGYTVDLRILATYGHNYHAAEYMKLTLDFFGRYRTGAQPKQE